MLNYFFNNKFFNNKKDIVSLYDDSISEVMGRDIHTYTLNKTYSDKIIIPTKKEEVENKTIIKSATIYLKEEITFLQNSQRPYIKWNENFYIVVGEMERVQYGFKYSLEYRNIDEVTS